MKLRLALLVILSSFYVYSQAQKIQYGVTGAISSSYVSGNGMSAKSQTGIAGGAYAMIPLTKKFSLQPEVSYNFMKVSRSDNFTTYYVNDSQQDSKVSFNLAYISIPILINYKISPKFTISAGPQYNILVYSNENLMFDKQAFKNSDFGIRGGIQFAPSTTFNLFASYYSGINNVNNIDTRYAWTNKQAQVGVHVAVFTSK